MRASGKVCLVICAFLGVLISCGPSTVMVMDENKAIKNAALISVSAPKSIDTGKTGNSMTTMIVELSQQKKLETSDAINDLKNKIIKNKSSVLPFRLASESEVQSRQGLREIIEAEKSSWTNFISVEGYPILTYRNRNEAKNFLSKEKSYDAAVIVDSFYSLGKNGFHILGFSFGNIVAQVTLNISAVNRKGDVILQYSVKGESKSKIYEAMGVYKVDSVNNACKEANDDALSQFGKWIQASQKR